MRTGLRTYLFLIIVVFLFYRLSWGSETEGRDKTVIPGGFPGYSYQLPLRNIIQGSDSVMMNHSLLVPNQDYALNCSTGEIYFTAVLKPSDTAVVYCLVLPFVLPGKIVYLPLSSPSVLVPDSAGTIPAFNPIKGQSYGNWLNEKSGQVRFGGSKSLGISAGSGRDFSLEQALQVSIDGQLSPSLKVNAFLSDQNMPLSPSGSTEDLSQIEKVYIKARGSFWEAVLGDYELDQQGTSYFQLKRQLQGIRASASSQNKGLDISAAVTKGQKTRIDITGQDGKQGPYLLAAGAGGAVAKILANTERVWLNGQLLKRGEQQDYQLDYETGQLTFSPRRPITSESRIMAEFEYSEQSYQRPFYSAAAAGELAKNFSVRGGYRQEGDDYTRPLSAELSQSDRNILDLAGDDTSRYWADGGTMVGAGQGNYSYRDSFYVYAGPDSGNYLVSFTKVDSGMGDYRDSLGILVYAGRGQGDYLAIKRLAAPTRMRTYTLGGYMTWPGGQADLEGAGTDLDNNLLSARDDGNNRGYSGTARLYWKRDTLWGGGFEVKARTTVQDPDFVKSAGPADPDFITHWGLYNWTGTRDLSSLMLRKATEYQVSFGPERLKAEASWGRLDLENSVWGRNYRAGLQFRPQPGCRLKYAFNRQLLGQAWPETTSLGQRNIHQAEAGVSYLRWNFLADLTAGTDLVQRDSTGDSGQKYYLAGLGMGRRGEVIDARLKISRREDYLKDSLDNIFKPKSYATDLTTTLGLLPGRALTGDLEHRYRRLTFRPGMTGQNLNTHLGLLRANYQGWQQTIRAGLDYSVSSSESRLKRETFYLVASRTGDYSYDPVTQTYYPDTAGNYLKKIEEEPSGTMASDISAKSYFSYSPGNSPSGPWYQNIKLDLNGTAGLKTAGKLSAAMMVFVPRSLWDRTANLSSSLDLAADLWCFQDYNRFLKFHYRARRSDDNQYVNRRISINSREARAEFNTQLPPAYRALLYGEQDINSTASLEYGLESESRGAKAGSEFSYLYRNRTELGIKTIIFWESLLRQGFYLSIPRVNYRDISISPFMNHQLGLKGNTRLEFSQTYRRADQAGNDIPLEFSVSRPTGQIQTWRLQADYRLSNFLTASASYDGRKEPQKKALHNARAEIRANF